jgi:hypothetical protein
MHGIGGLRRRRTDNQTFGKNEDGNADYFV